MGTSGYVVKRGEIWLTTLNPTLGHEMRKTRPALVIQNDIGNRHSPLTIIAPITSKNIDTGYTFQVKLEQEESGLDRNSKVMLDQLRAIDKKRLVKRMGFVQTSAMYRVNDALRVVLSL